MATSIARFSTGVSRRRRFGIGIELSLQGLQLRCPFEEGMHLAVGGDAALVELARRHPFVLFGELGGELGDRLAVFDRQLGAPGKVGERGVRPARVPTRASAGAAFSSSGVVDFAGDRLEPRRDRLGHELAPQRQIVDQDERLVVPELGDDDPVEERTHRPPALDGPFARGLCVRPRGR